MAQLGARNARLNQAAFSLAQLVAGGALSEHVVHDSLVSAAHGCGLDEHEAERTIASGLAAGAKNPRTAPNSDVPHDAGVPHVTRLRLAALDGGEWPEPTELPGLLPVPAWDHALLPDLLRPWVSDVADRTQCPAEYVAVGAVVALGSIVGRGCAIRPKQHDDWTVVPNLWGAIVGPPSAMKTPALAEALRPLKAVAAEASERHAAQSGAREELEAQLMAAKKSLRAAAEKGQGTDGQRARYEELMQLSAAATRERRYIVYDTTVEKLGEILNASPRGVLLARDELSGWFGGLERQGHESDRAFYLEAWNGTNEFVYDRIGRGTIRIESACVSIIGGIQPGPLSRYLRDAVSGGIGADGLMQRFQLLVYPDPPRTWQTTDRSPDTTARQQCVELYRRMAELTPEAAGADSSDGIPFVRFGREAQHFFDAWHARLMQRVRSGAEHEAMEGHLIKYSSLMPSLALIFQMADSGTGPVGLIAAQRAAAWCELLEAHARRVYASATTSEVDTARALLAKIRTGKLRSPFVARDVYDAGWSGLTDTESVRRALEVLERHGYVRLVEVPTAGRPRSEVHVHPALSPSISRKEAAE